MKRIQPQLLVAFTGVILVVLCGVSIIMIAALRELPSADTVVFNELTTQARLLSQVLRRNEMLLERPRTSMPLLDELAERNKLRIAITNSEGTVLYDSEGEWLQPNIDPLSHLHKRENGLYAGELTIQDARWLAIAAPDPTPENPEHYLILAKATPKVTAWTRFRNSLAKPMIQAGLVALTLGITLSMIISRSIARPLKDVAKAATAIAQGQLNARAPEKGPQEVRQTAQAFNAMAQRVQASQTAQRDLVANIAHDLRTPLTSIQGYAQALTDGTASTPETQAYAARVILDESHRLHTMTTSLVDLARFEAGQVNLALASLNLNELIQDRVTFYQSQAQPNNVRLTAQLPPVSLNVNADAVRITQVLDNLLSNALRHTSTEGRIVVAARQVEQTIQVSVADTGTGIPAEDLPRIFERFYRGDKSRQRGGTGLGLAIVKQIINAHGGDITVESVVGVGTKFTFTLPTG